MSQNEARQGPIRILLQSTIPTEENDWCIERFSLLAEHLASLKGRVLAVGTSQTTQRQFNLIVAFERSLAEDGVPLGRGIAESSFHHFADYNWDVFRGCPNFVSEK